MLTFEITDNDFHDNKYLLKTPGCGGDSSGYILVGSNRNVLGTKGIWFLGQ